MAYAVVVIIIVVVIIVIVIIVIVIITIIIIIIITIVTTTTAITTTTTTITVFIIIFIWLIMCCTEFSNIWLLCNSQCGVRSLPRAPTNLHCWELNPRPFNQSDWIWHLNKLAPSPHSPPLPSGCPPIPLFPFSKLFRMSNLLLLSNTRILHDWLEIPGLVFGVFFQPYLKVVCLWNPKCFMKFSAVCVRFSAVVFLFCFGFFFLCNKQAYVTVFINNRQEQKVCRDIFSIAFSLKQNKQLSHFDLVSCAVIG